MNLFGHLLICGQNNLVIHFNDEASVLVKYRLAELRGFGMILLPGGDPDGIIRNLNRVFGVDEVASEQGCEEGGTYYSSVRA